jgi:hypothetical protein
VEFPSGVRKQVAWRSQAPIPDTLAAAKEYAAAVVDALLKDQRVDDLDRTNIPSLVAAIQRLLQDWNETRRRDLHLAGPAPQLVQ